LPANRLRPHPRPNAPEPFPQKTFNAEQKTTFPLFYFTSFGRGKSFPVYKRDFLNFTVLKNIFLHLFSDFFFPVDFKSYFLRPLTASAHRESCFRQ